MNPDALLKSLPIVGGYFQKAYAFWVSHVAIANTTHIVLGLGIGLLCCSRWKKWGMVFILGAVFMHIVVFFGKN